MNRVIGVIVFLFIALFIAIQSIFIVDEREKVLVQRFGAIQPAVEDPGLYFKLPFIDQIYRYDDRLLALDTDELEVTFVNNRRLIVDAFSRWRISDVRDYHLAVSREGQQGAMNKLARILTDALAAVLGDVRSDEVLSADRTRLMQSILDEAAQSAADMGVQIVDVRIIRADLPDQNLMATFDRMNAERQQEAADERARGQEAARRITAAAERESVEIESGAKREATIIMGEADAERNSIFAEVYNRDVEFFDFYRSLQAYRNSMLSENTAIVMSPESDFFRYLQDDGADGNPDLTQE